MEHDVVVDHSETAGVEDQPDGVKYEDECQDGQDSFLLIKENENANSKNKSKNEA